MLNLGLQHNIVDACALVLSSMDFEERKMVSLDDEALPLPLPALAHEHLGDNDNKVQQFSLNRALREP